MKPYADDAPMRWRQQALDLAALELASLGVSPAQGSGVASGAR